MTDTRITQYSPDDPATDPVLSIRVPTDLRDRLAAYCRTHDRNRSQVIRLALTAYLAQETSHE